MQETPPHLRVVPDINPSEVDSEKLRAARDALLRAVLEDRNNPDTPEPEPEPEPPRLRIVG